MADRTSPIDWVEDVCYLTDFMAASYENKIYTVGGLIFTTFETLGISDSYLRILDFSKPVDLTKNIINIRTDNITKAIRLPDNIPRLVNAILLISDGVMHMLPGAHGYFNIADADGNALNTYRTNLTNKVWSLDLQSQKWDVQTSGMKDRAWGAAVAFDTEKQVGWYYGGVDMPDTYYNGTVLVDFSLNRSSRSLQDLYRLDKGKGTPVKVETNSSIVGKEDLGELVYIEGAGEVGILVLIGGSPGVQVTQLRPMETVHVFDIATETWFAQSTTAQAENYPTSRIGFCSVVASAEDNSSHNIYIHGGWSQSRADREEEIFILTLPAFHWISVYPSGKDKSHIDMRLTSYHRCQKVHEKHMVAYRGANVDNRCDSDEGLGKFQGIAIYDMSSLVWTTIVELENPKYLVPPELHDIIGGNEMGNATITEPLEGFQDPKLAQIFTAHIFVNKTTPVNITPANRTTPVTTLPTNDYPQTILPTIDHSQRRIPVGGIAGGIIGSFVFILLIAKFFLLRRQQRMVAPPQSPQELQGCGLYELHDPRNISELPPPTPTELVSSVPER